MLLFEVDCGLGHGEDQQGGDKGGHQCVHVVPLESGKGDESGVLIKFILCLLYIQTNSI